MNKKDNRFVHGLSGHKLYGTYHAMIDRCHNEKNIKYNYYGGRGIKVYDKWREDISSFLEYVDDTLGDRPKGYTLDRIDNSKGYEPGNLKWSNREEQNINQRLRKNITGHRNIEFSHGGYYVKIVRGGVRRCSISHKYINDALKLRDLWLEEYKNNKEEYINNTINKNYERRF